MSTEHISYAMRNDEVRQSLLWLNSPVELLHWSMPLLELLVTAGALLALLHAFQCARRESNPAYLFTWFTTIFYGLTVEIISYNFVDNFWHGEFSVMFYHNHLPLYIMMLYPAVLYPTFMLVRGFKLHDKPYGRLVEVCCAGFAAQMFYAPFDNMGPMLEWWIWDRTSLSLQPFWRSVPSTSYLWIMTLSMAFYFLVRWLLWERAIHRHYSIFGWWLSALALGVATNVAGVLLQTPVSILSQIFSAYFLAGSIIAIMMLVNAWVFWLSPRDRSACLDPLLLIFPVLWVSFFTVLYCYFFSTIIAANSAGISEYGTPTGNYALAVIGLVMAVLIYIAPAIRQVGTKKAKMSSSPEP